jgi:hypothetical protein
MRAMLNGLFTIGLVLLATGIVVIIAGLRQFNVVNAQRPILVSHTADMQSSWQYFQKTDQAEAKETDDENSLFHTLEEWRAGIRTYLGEQALAYHIRITLDELARSVSSSTRSSRSAFTAFFVALPCLALSGWLCLFAWWLRSWEKKRD